MAVRNLPLQSVCRKWLLANLDHFRLDPEWSTVELFKNLKPFGELLLLATTNRHATNGSLGALQEHLRGWLAQNQPDADRLADVCREFPQTLPWLGLIWQNYELLDVPVPKLRQALEGLVRIRNILYFERHAGHDICVHHMIERLGRPSPFDLRELYSRTMVARRAWDSPGETAIYYICHDIFFLTNWGQIALRHPVRPTREWRKKLAAWYRDCLRAGNIDLASELSMALSFLRGTARLKALSGADTAASSGRRLPAAPKGQGDGFISPGDSQDRVLFFRNYHTVIVCLIALSRCEYDAAGTRRT